MNWVKLFYGVIIFTYFFCAGIVYNSFNVNDTSEHWIFLSIVIVLCVLLGCFFLELYDKEEE